MSHTSHSSIRWKIVSPRMEDHDGSRPHPLMPPIQRKTPETSSDRCFGPGRLRRKPLKTSIDPPPLMEDYGDELPECVLDSASLEARHRVFGSLRRRLTARFRTTRLRMRDSDTEMEAVLLDFGSSSEDDPVLTRAEPLRPGRQPVTRHPPRVKHEVIAVDLFNTVRLIDYGLRGCSASTRGLVDDVRITDASEAWTRKDSICGTWLY